MDKLDKTRVLTIGSSGLIGSYIDFGLRPHRAELDVLDQVALMAFVRAEKPHTIIHLAGATDTRACEQDPAKAYMRNAVSAYYVALAANAVDAKAVYVSTSRVFNGKKKTSYTEDDMPDPQSIYGHSKYLGESAFRAVAKKYLVARTCWVFGGGPKRDSKFYGSIIRALKQDQRVSAIDDVYGSPTYAKDFIAALMDAIDSGVSGVVHIGNTGIASRYESALLVAQRLKKPELVEKRMYSDTQGYDLLPENESIVSARVSLRTWHEALASYLKDEWSI